MTLTNLRQRPGRQTSVAPSIPPVCCVRAAGATLLRATCPSRATTCTEPSDWLTGRGKVRLHTLSGSHRHGWLTLPIITERATSEFPHSCFGLRTVHNLLSSLDYRYSSVPSCAGILCLHFGLSVFFKTFTTMPSEKTVTKCSETRRSTKPIMEKRRRARINNSLSELKNLILDALKKDNARHSKLEKADILEMTVKHLQNLQIQQHQQQQLTPDPNMMGKFRAGFAECANEVNRFMTNVDGIDHTIRQRLLNHLANCLTGMNNPPPTPLPPVHVQVSNESQDASSTRVGVHLVPTRLPNGDIAFLLPAVYAPSTIPISPASSTSSVTSPLSAPSPVNVLGSSGILSPAASDRSSPSPVMHRIKQSRSPVPVMSESPVHFHDNTVSVISRYPSSYVSQQQQSKAVWRPF